MKIRRLRCLFHWTVSIGKLGHDGAILELRVGPTADVLDFSRRDCLVVCVRRCVGESESSTDVKLMRRRLNDQSHWKFTTVNFSTASAIACVRLYKEEIFTRWNRHEACCRGSLG